MKKQKAKIALKDLKARKDVKGGGSHITGGNKPTGGHGVTGGNKPSNGSSINVIHV